MKSLQVRCLNWSHPSQDNSDTLSIPLFQKNRDGKLVYTGGRFVPYMETTSTGVTSLKMISRSDNSGSKTPTASCTYNWDYDEGQGDSDISCAMHEEEELLGIQAGVGSRTSIIVKLKGDLDVMISPLLLESFQRFVDALTPTVSSLHPLTVVNHLHASCVAQVKSTSILKNAKNIALLGQLQHEGKDPTNIGMYEETIKKQLQAAIVIPKINVTMLQVSIVEEIISFSALDNMKDLTCVSLFYVCFDNITAKFHSDKQVIYF